MRTGDGKNIVEKWVDLLPNDQDWQNWLPDLLDTGLETGLFYGAVVENTIGPKRICAFGLSAFIPQEIYDEFFSRPEPYLNARLLSRFRNGENQVFLDEIAQAKRNRSDGLNMMVLEYFSENHDYNDPLAIEIGNCIVPQYMKCQAGFNIKSNIHETEEIFGSLQLAGGQQELIRFDTNHPYSLRDGGLGPRAVYGLTRENRIGFAVGGVANLVMIYQRPTLNLVPVEQKTIRQAIDGLTDQAISEENSISLDAVKQRWQTIYSHIEGAEPDFFGPYEIDDNRITRGPEKRRIVVSKLTSRFEELRPYCLRRGSR